MPIPYACHFNVPHPVFSGICHLLYARGGDILQNAHSKGTLKLDWKLVTAGFLFEPSPQLTHPRLPMPHWFICIYIAPAAGISYKFLDLILQVLR
jgi:hypothetical protein